MVASKHPPILAIYTSGGDIGAFIRYPYLFSSQGEYIGWVNPAGQVYSVHGHYVGWISEEPRILRKSSSTYFKPLDQIPGIPESIQPPAVNRLAPMMPELSYGIIDVLQDQPEMLPAMDFGDLRPHMD